MSTDTLIAKIEHEISVRGGNRHQYPFTIGKHKDQWNVIIEVDSRTKTFDIETISPSLPAALTDALTALRRAYQ